MEKVRRQGYYIYSKLTIPLRNGRRNYKKGSVPFFAVHALTTGTVGSMTMAVMTRATLGHTGRPKHAESLTVWIYLLVNLGAILRLLTPTQEGSATFLLGLAAIGWSGAYLLFAMKFGPYLLGPSLDTE